jgi:hypothetical protein
LQNASISSHEGVQASVYAINFFPLGLVPVELFDAVGGAAMALTKS